MKYIPSLVNLWASIALLLPRIYSAENVVATKDVEEDHGDCEAKSFLPLWSECSIWMAPSSLPGESGFGIYATRDIARSESILNGPDAVSIPVGHYHPAWRKGKKRKAWKRLWDDYWWGRGVPDHVYYDTLPEGIDYQVTFGSLPNHHCVLDSISHRYDPNPYRDNILDRWKDPGAGAVSYSMGRVFYAKREVNAPRELFLNYGHCERDEDSAKSSDWTQKVYMPSDFHQAATIIRNSTNVAIGADGRIVFPDENELNPLVASLLPKTEFHRRALLTEESKKDLVRKLALSTLKPRTSEWIKENGFCLENLIPLKSTIPQAGHGAFAQFSIKKDEIVVPAPLLQIMDRDFLNTAMYDEEGHLVEPVHTQVLMNYCFGHRDMAMLLCPNSNAILINHCSIRTKDCGDEGPNAEVRWSSGWDPTSDTWRTMTLGEIAEKKYRVLSFEIIALRNIAPGEEVTIDYGAEWESAWQEHIKKWEAEPPQPIEPFITAEELNSELGPVPDFLMSGDLREVVDHPYLMAGCRYKYYEGEDDDDVYLKERRWEDGTDDEILELYASDGSRYGYKKGYNYTTHEERSHWPCSIIRSEEDDEDEGHRYTVRILQTVKGDRMPWEEHGLPRILTNYSRSSIHFFAFPYEADQHLKNAFRQPIGIPDHMMPPQWKSSSLSAE